MWVFADRVYLLLEPDLLHLNPVFDRGWQLGFQDLDAVLGHRRKFLLNLQCVDFDHANFLILWQQVLIFRLLSLKSMQECLDDLTWIFEAFVIQYTEINRLVLPVLNQELVVHAKELVDFAEGIVDELVDLLTVVVVEWVTVEPLVTIKN